MFSLQLPKILTSRLMRPLALLAIAALAAPGAAMADSDWTSVGSTGIVDESCYMAVQMDLAEARLVPGLLFPCKVRYQVTDTFGTASPVHITALIAHLRDTSPLAERVEVRLFAYPKATGLAVPPLPTAVLAINSDTTASVAVLGGFRAYTAASPTACPAGTALNFTLNSYWIEVDLIPGPLPSLTPPAVRMLTLDQC